MKISQLTPLAAPTASARIPVVVAGQNMTMTAEQIASLLPHAVARFSEVREDPSATSLKGSSSDATLPVVYDRHHGFFAAMLQSHGVTTYYRDFPDFGKFYLPGGVLRDDVLFVDSEALVWVANGEGALAGIGEGVLAALEESRDQALEAVREASSVDVVVASYAIHNNTNTISSATQRVQMPTGRHKLRITPPWTGRLAIYDRETETTGDLTIIYDNASVTEGDTIVIDVTNTKPWVSFRSWTNDVFDYVVEDLVEVTFADAVGRLGETNDRVSALEEADASGVNRVVATYGIRNRHDGVAWETQWVSIPPGRHTLRINLDYTGTLTIYDSHVRLSVNAENAVTHTYNVHEGENIIETDIEREYQGFRTRQQRDFYYAVEDIEPMGAREAAESLSPLLRTSGCWMGKTLATYGDSVTAINNGDWTLPYGYQTWGNVVASHLRMARHYGRGVGSQTWRWANGGGAAVILDEATGNYADRDNSKNKDTYAGTLGEGQTLTRGAGCSWDRITKMFPASIKDGIDVVLAMYHNDAGYGLGTLEWVEGSDTDPEWAASEAYGDYGGDYNIGTVRGGIASAVMKLQAWMPNAVVVLCTPLSGRGVTGQKKPTLRDEQMEAVADAVREMGRVMSVPVIDVYATCGINGLNREKYISDSIHPYLLAGQRMLARAVMGGLGSIYPMIKGM